MSVKHNSASLSPPEPAPPSRILVPTDGSTNAVRALKVAINMAKAFHSEIVIVNVIPAPGIVLVAPIGLGIPPLAISQYYEQQESGAKNLVEQALSICRQQGVTDTKTQVVRAEKSVVEEIIALATYRKANLIIIGTRGLGGFKRLMLGSVSSGVVTHATCDVLVVR